jgi:uncharacterized repeat protein (TIGR03943 family)
MSNRQEKSSVSREVIWSRASGVSLSLLGILLLNYRLQEKLILLIHRRYLLLATLAGGVLLLLGLYRILKPSQGSTSRWPTLLLIGVVGLGLVNTPRPLSSQTALNRGVDQTLRLQGLGSQPQAFRPKLDPAQRTLIEWIRTLEVNPDPVNYQGQPVQVKGFVIASTGSANQFTLAQFLIRCCAADAYPVGLPVLWAHANQIPLDSWQEVKGWMAVMPEDPGKVAIQAEHVTAINPPVNPYAY